MIRYIEKITFIHLMLLVSVQALPDYVPAQEQTAATQTGTNSNGAVFDPDAPPKARIELLPFLTLGAEIELEYEFESNLDLDDSEDEDQSTIEPELSLALSFDPSENFQAFLSTESTWEFEKEEGEDWQRQASFSVTQAYIFLKNLFYDGVSFQIGRQRFDDDREWLYDEELDAVRVFYEISAFTLELSASRLNLVDRDLANEGESERINNYAIYGKYEIALGEEEVDVAAYGVFRDDRSEERQSPILFGIHSDGEILNDLEHWLELAYAGGNDGDDDIGGIGFDIGAVYEFDFSIEPSLTLAYAFGSEKFRQTGLQENEDRFNGVASFKYYGVLLDPELSNLSIFTGGVGVKPTRDSSVDIVYHYYRQHRASEEIRDSALDADPDGVDKSLGSEIDLVIGYEEIENVQMELVLGYFIPGSAFPDGADNAFFTGLEIEYSF